jgi:DNA topoisomerase-1
VGAATAVIEKRVGSGRANGRANGTIASDVEDIAELGLIFSSDAEAGIRRVRSKSGFRYERASGAVEDERTLSRIRGLVIPPAWEDVWICGSPRGHLQATGRDARGRKQYRYHKDYRAHREASKYDRLLEFGERLPRLRAAVRRDLAKRGLGRDRVIALAIDLLERTLIRVGNESYAAENGSYGLTTLRNRHMRVHSNGVTFAFKGKSGKQHEVRLEDQRASRLLRTLQDLPGQELFQYRDDSGEAQRITSNDINDYLRGVMGDEFTAKDIRTWSGTLFAASLLGKLEPPSSEAEAKRTLTEVVREVAGQLHNTPAVCRACYIHPAIEEAYRSGELQRVFGAPVARRRRHMAEDEERLVGFLRKARRATRRQRKAA